jgi:hypothetical protein
MSILQTALWLLAASLLSAIAYRVWTRRLYCDYPLFSAYIAGQLVRFLALFYCYRLGIREIYRHVYLYAEVVDAVLKFGVICELFSQVFRPYEGIRSLVSPILRWASLILLLVAILVSVAGAGSDSDTFLAGFFAMERSVEIVQGGLLFLLFVLSTSLGLHLKHYTLGIALGFGVVTSVNLVAYTLRAQLGTSSHGVLSLISSAAYNCAVLAWTATVYRHKPVDQLAQPILHWDVESWNRLLVDFLRR